MRAESKFKATPSRAHGRETSRMCGVRLRKRLSREFEKTHVLQPHTGGPSKAQASRNTSCKVPGCEWCYLQARASHSVLQQQEVCARGFCHRWLWVRDSARDRRAA